MQLNFTAVLTHVCISIRMYRTSPCLSCTTTERFYCYSDGCVCMPMPYSTCKKNPRIACVTKTMYTYIYKHTLYIQIDVWCEPESAKNKVLWNTCTIYTHMSHTCTCVCVCIYIYIYTFMYVYIHTLTGTCADTCTCIHKKSQCCFAGMKVPHLCTTYVYIHTLTGTYAHAHTHKKQCCSFAGMTVPHLCNMYVYIHTLTGTCADICFAGMTVPHLCTCLACQLVVFKHQLWRRWLVVVVRHPEFFLKKSAKSGDFMRVNMYEYMYVCMYVCIHTHTHTHTHSSCDQCNLW